MTTHLHNGFSFDDTTGALLVTGGGGGGGDVTQAGNNAFTGTNSFALSPTAPTATVGDNTTKVATTAFVLANVGSGGGDVTKAGTNAFTGTNSFANSPTVPTAAANDSSSKVASTAYADATAVSHSLAAISSIPQNVVAAVGLSNTSVATPTTIDGITPSLGAFILLGAQTTASQNGYWTYNGSGNALTRPTWWGTGSVQSGLSAAASGGTAHGGQTYFCFPTTGATGLVGTASFSVANDTTLAPKASPTFTGTPAAPTAAALTNTTQIATTAFTTAAVAAEATARGTSEALLAPKASPALTGTPTAPTAATATSTTQLATTAFVHAVASGGGASWPVDGARIQIATDQGFIGGHNHVLQLSTTNIIGTSFAGLTGANAFAVPTSGLYMVSGTFHIVSGTGGDGGADFLLIDASNAAVLVAETAQFLDPNGECWVSFAGFASMVTSTTYALSVINNLANAFTVEAANSSFGLVRLV